MLREAGLDDRSQTGIVLDKKYSHGANLHRATLGAHAVISMTALHPMIQHDNRTVIPAIQGLQFQHIEEDACSK